MKQIYYDGMYLQNNPTWHEEDAAWKAVQISKIIEKNGLTPNTICEVGCGTGEILNQLSFEYPEKAFYGYEISPQAYNLSKEKSKPNLIFKLQDLLEDDSMYFDIVMAIDVIEHVEDYFGFLRKLKEKAEYKIFHIPLDLSVQTVLRGTPIVKVRELVGHIHYFTKDIALATLKDTDYEVMDYFYTAASLDVPRKNLKTTIANIPRKIGFAVNKDLTVSILGGYSLLILAK